MPDNEPSKPVYKVVYDKKREASSRGRKAYTFTIDGQPTLYWSPTEEAIKRVISRLQQGRSGEAFGGAGFITPGGVMATSRGHGPKARGKVVSAGEVTTETVEMKSGKTKVKEKRPGFIFELDGKPPKEIEKELAAADRMGETRVPKLYHGEQDAKIACAEMAFMTRGRFGRFAEAEAAFKDQFGKKCKVHLFNGKVVAKDQDGNLWAVGLQAGYDPWFKPLVSAPPTKEK